MSRLVIINPVSGAKKALAMFEEIKPLLEEMSFKSLISENIGHIYKIANEISFEEFESVIIIGGDGTMHEFINGMMDRKDGGRIPIGLMPGGTGNSLLHDLDSLKPEVAIDKIMKGKTMMMDIAKVSFANDHVYAFNVIGWGIPSTINQKAEKLKFFGSQRYNLASLIEIVRNPNWKVKFEMNDASREGNYSFFLACNTIYTGNGMKIAPKAKLDDGLFDLVILKKASRFKLVKLFAKIFEGRHINQPLVQYQQSSEFAVSDTEPAILIIDGQVVGETPFTAKVLPGEIEVFI